MSSHLGIHYLAAAVLAVLASSTSWCQIADFEDLMLAPESYYNGADGAGGFVSRRARFSNEYEATFGSWSGFSYSNVTDNTTPGFVNQYSAIAGSGADGRGNYGVGFVSSFGPDTRIEFPSPASVVSLAITNTTYAALSMRDGDDFAKKFGGASGADPDFFIATIVGLDASEVAVGEVTFAAGRLSLCGQQLGLHCGRLANCGLVLAGRLCLVARVPVDNLGYGYVRTQYTLLFRCG